MTAVGNRPGRRRARSNLTRATLVGAVGAVGLGLATARFGTDGFALSLVLLVCMAAAGLRAPKVLLVATLVWLPMLGLVRRLVFSPSHNSQLDPLLLVAPVAVMLLLLAAVKHGALKEATSLTKAILLFDVLAVASFVNPIQGGPLVGLAGLLFVLVPTLWFWLGRGLVDDVTFRRIVAVVAVVGLFSAVYGLTQTLSGFPSFDQAWIDARAYTALRVGLTVRAFGPFVAASDYAIYLGVAFIVFVSVAIQRRARVLCAVCLVLLAWAIFLEGSHGIVVLLCGAVGAVIAGRRGVGWARAALAGAVVLTALLTLLGHLDAQKFSDPRTAALLQRQVTGLSDPFDVKKSTLPIHLDLFKLGISSGLSAPFGRGAGAVTIAGSKFGGASFGTEADPSNVTVALGFPGLAVYLYVSALSLSRGYRMLRTRRDLLSAVVVGTLLVTILQWFNGGNYGVSPLPWLMIGWLDRPLGDDAEEDAAVEDIGDEDLDGGVAPDDEADGFELAYPVL